MEKNVLDIIGNDNYHPERLFAVFSGVHANLPALQAVLADIQSKGVRERYCLGNIIDFAPWPNEVIALLRQENISVIGGSDDVFIDEPISTLSGTSSAHQDDAKRARQAAILWRNATLTDENNAWLKSLAYSIRLVIGDANILLSQFSPSVHCTLSEDKLIDLKEKYSFDVCISNQNGRADIRYLKDRNNRPFVIASPGTVGKIASGEPQASWLLCHYIRGRIELKAYWVNYDVAGTAQAIRQSDVPDYYAKELMRNGMSCTFDLFTF